MVLCMIPAGYLADRARNLYTSVYLYGLLGVYVCTHIIIIITMSYGIYRENLEFQGAHDLLHTR